jgi:hypothetical protein
VASTLRSSPSLDCNATQGGMRVQQGQLARQTAQPPRAPLVRASSSLSACSTGRTVALHNCCSALMRWRRQHQWSDAMASGLNEKRGTFAFTTQTSGCDFARMASPWRSCHRLGRRSISREGLLSFVVTSCFFLFPFGRQDEHRHRQRRHHPYAALEPSTE